MGTQSLTSSEELRRLRWQCRRGTRELDALLLRYLDRLYPTASQAQRAVFERLLSVQDPQLADWFYGRAKSPDAELQAMVDSILDVPV